MARTWPKRSEPFVDAIRSRLASTRSTGTACTAIAGATNQTYTLTSPEAGATVRVQGTASDMAGTGQVSSVHTAIVTAPSSRRGWRRRRGWSSAALGGSKRHRLPHHERRRRRGSGQHPALRHRHLAARTTFKYALSEVATVKIAIFQRLPGRRRGKTCRAPSKTLRHMRRCIRIVLRGTLIRTSASGPNSGAFSGRIGSKALKPGRYQATLAATNAAQRTSKPTTLTFTVVKQ